MMCYQLHVLLSPIGGYAIHFVSSEMRMSHWIDSPVVIETASGLIFFSQADSLWSASGVKWREDSQRVVFDLLRYPGDAPSLRMEIKLPRQSARVSAPGEQVEITLQGPANQALLDWLESRYQRSRIFPKT
jgi:hypothetical protein